jgi:[ribosomal protein S5]-alanine N-acetyltransferase
MHFVPIKKLPEENATFLHDPLFVEPVLLTLDFYKETGYSEPWIGYYVQEGDNFIGSAGFKGPPVNNIVEIAYGTFEEYRRKGVGTAICSKLVELVIQTDPLLEIIAHTLPSNKFSEQVLLKNNFCFLGLETTNADSKVCCWMYSKKAGKCNDFKK